jgi:hypothetical protein
LIGPAKLLFPNGWRQQLIFWDGGGRTICESSVLGFDDFWDII